LGHRSLVIVLGLMTLLFSYSPLSGRLDDSLFKVYARLLPQDDLPPQTVMVAVDDLTDAVNGPVSFKALGDLIELLGRAGTSGIGVLFPLHSQQSRTDIDRVRSEISRYNNQKGKHQAAGWANVMTLIDGDRYLDEAIRKAGRVVLAAGFGADGGDECWVPDSLTPYTEDRGRNLMAQFWRSPLSDLHVTHFPGNTFTRSAAAIGIDCGRAAEGAFPLLIASDRGEYPAFLLQLIGQSGRQRQDARLVDGKAVIVGDRRFETGPGYRLLPHPLRQSGDDTQLFHAGELLKDKTLLKRLNNKYVLIGYANEAMGTATAVSGGEISSARSPAVGMSMPLVASAADAMLAQRYYSAPAWQYVGQRMVIIAVIVYLLLLPARLRGLTGIVLHLFTLIALLNVTFILLLSRNIWFPMTLPAALLLCGGVLLLVRHRVASGLNNLRHEAANAYRELARNYQSQGQLDVAFEYLSKCPVDGATVEPLYNLGMDFERRRQFSKALFVYERIGQRIPGYRDIAARQEKLSAMPAFFPDTGAVSDNNAMATMIVEDSMIARPVIGRYQIERELGRGAMGMVYLGSDPKIGRTVAIKTLALASEFDGQQLDSVKRRFYQEAETAGQLNHPNIVTIYDVGEEHDLAYIAMDYVRGNRLADYTEPENLLPLAEVFDIGIQIAVALDYAHAHKVVHRDVKPANIIFDRDSGNLKVMDFGIACLTDNSKTRTGTVLGSPFYMSPEQVAGKRVDGRSDLYSLGVTLYQLLCGYLPFSGDSLATLMYHIAHDKPVGIRKLRREVPACLARVVSRALEKDVDKRLQSGQAFADALYDCAERQHMTTELRVRR